MSDDSYVINFTDGSQHSTLDSLRESLNQTGRTAGLGAVDNTPWFSNENGKSSCVLILLLIVLLFLLGNLKLI